MSEQHDIPPADGKPAPGDYLYSRRLRRPRIVPFLLSGAVIGLLLGCLVAWFGERSRIATLPQELILLGAIGGLLGGLVGAVAYLVADWAARR